MKLEPETQGAPKRMACPQLALNASCLAIESGHLSAGNDSHFA
jgi:hypothetical protein